MAKAQGSSDAWYRRQLHGFWKWLAWSLTILLLAYIALVIYRIPAVNEQKKSDAAVAAIEAQHLTMADVDGNHLPPPPDPSKVNATVAGIDANGNGIRDDVELAIFAEYPTSSATSTAIRAAELQYAMTEQMFLTDVFDSATWKAVAEQADRAYQCIGDNYSRKDVQAALNLVQIQTDETEALVFNTNTRKNYLNEIDNKDETGFGLPAGSVCDLALDSAPT